MPQFYPLTRYEKSECSILNLTYQCHSASNLMTRGVPTSWTYIEEMQAFKIWVTLTFEGHSNVNLMVQLDNPYMISYYPVVSKSNQMSFSQTLSDHLLVAAKYIAAGKVFSSHWARISENPYAHPYHRLIFSNSDHFFDQNWSWAHLVHW